MYWKANVVPSMTFEFYVSDQTSGLVGGLWENKCWFAVKTRQTIIHRCIISPRHACKGKLWESLGATDSSARMSTCIGVDHRPAGAARQQLRPKAKRASRSFISVTIAPATSSSHTVMSNEREPIENLCYSAACKTQGHQNHLQVVGPIVHCANMTSRLCINRHVDLHLCDL